MKKIPVFISETVFYSKVNLWEMLINLRSHNHDRQIGDKWKFSSLGWISMENSHFYGLKWWKSIDVTLLTSCCLENFKRWTTSMKWKIKQEKNI